ncbi:nuclease-related domain-containing protein [Heyndrickxia vini]|uniref:NERD domain-containing protein n=1 Tax=Heyndrickxia vini TaxID=1476025 RepID=A0ABX7DZ43_9BACI|nr:nuclease-related domain-containing protein [Heyndrickxia vini]QQZ08225.1 NERD domain-containing protein [Heyndrickxia vini]
MKLLEDDLSYFNYLEKGFAGEKMFDNLIKEHISIKHIFLNDLLLEHNNTKFQIDSLLFFSNTIHFFEIKNYEGDYYIDNDLWYKSPQKEIKNPLHQLKRSTSLLRGIFQELRINIPIAEHLVFVNPEFHLYNAPMNLPITYPTQLNRLMEKLNNKNNSNINDIHIKLANRILNRHIKEPSFSRLPDYTFDHLEKGITCANCDAFVETYKKTTVTCTYCGFKENITNAVIRSIDEYSLLFPDRKITKNAIQEWCKIASHKTIKRILTSNYNQIGKSISTHYVKQGN